MCYGKANLGIAGTFNFGTWGASKVKLGINGGSTAFIFNFGIDGACKALILLTESIVNLAGF